MLLMRAALHLCSTCNLTLTHVAIANERKGNGGAIDFFTGGAGLGGGAVEGLGHRGMGALGPGLVKVGHCSRQG